MDTIKKKAIVVNNGDITLSSGQKTRYFYELKNILINSKGLTLIGDLLLEKAVKEYGAKSVGGLELGAIPISSAIILRSFGKYAGNLTSFFVRKQPKSHGLKKKIEGTLVEPVVIVDDVLTTGRSIMQAIEAVTNEGKKSVAGVICIIDREIDENLNLLKKNKIKYSPLFRNSEFMLYIERKMKRDLKANLK